MENNNYSQQQYNPQYQQTYQQPAPAHDPEYEAKAKDFLTKAIVSCCISTIPVGSFIAIAMATKNRKALLDYIEQGGLHTTKVQVSSALSRAGKYSGIACSVFWGIYLTYWVIAFLIMIIAVIGGLSSY
ncbi:hypothetical protein SAMN02910264_01497 [Ruminococcaceae bacterium YAD3003]|nr:hypothetical protein SAMN02910264_01497 [Ruminococcaceae bacterium YAD3003]